MKIEKRAGSQQLNHLELWVKKAELTAIEADDAKIDEFLACEGDVVAFVKDEGEVYYLDEDSRRFKPIGE